MEDKIRSLREELELLETSHDEMLASLRAELQARTSDLHVRLAALLRVSEIATAMRLELKHLHLDSAIPLDLLATVRTLQAVQIQALTLQYETDRKDAVTTSAADKASLQQQQQQQQQQQVREGSASSGRISSVSDLRRLVHCLDEFRERLRPLCGNGNDSGTDLSPSSADLPPIVAQDIDLVRRFILSENMLVHAMHADETTAFCFSALRRLVSPQVAKAWVLDAQKRRFLFHFGSTVATDALSGARTAVAKEAATGTDPLLLLPPEEDGGEAGHAPAARITAMRKAERPEWMFAHVAAVLKEFGASPSQQLYADCLAQFQSFFCRFLSEEVLHPPLSDDQFLHFVNETIHFDSAYGTTVLKSVIEASDAHSARWLRLDAERLSQDSGSVISAVDQFVSTLQFLMQARYNRISTLSLRERFISSVVVPLIEHAAASLVDDNDDNNNNNNNNSDDGRGGEESFGELIRQVVLLRSKGAPPMLAAAADLQRKLEARVDGISLLHETVAELAIEEDSLEDVAESLKYRRRRSIERLVEQVDLSPFLLSSKKNLLMVPFRHFALDHGDALVTAVDGDMSRLLYGSVLGNAAAAAAGSAGIQLEREFDRDRWNEACAAVATAAMLDKSLVRQYVRLNDAVLRTGGGKMAGERLERDVQMLVGRLISEYPSLQQQQQQQQSVQASTREEEEEEEERKVHAPNTASSFRNNGVSAVLLPLSRQVLSILQLGRRRATTATAAASQEDAVDGFEGDDAAMEAEMAPSSIGERIRLVREFAKFHGII